MTRVYTSVELGVSAAEVWERIGGWNSLADWHPGVERSELDSGGRVRRLTLAGGAGTIVEELKSADEAQRTYSYAILETPEPVTNYIGTLTVTDRDAGCLVEWSSEFDPYGATEEEAIDEIRASFEEGLENLKILFGG